VEDARYCDMNLHHLIPDAKMESILDSLEKSVRKNDKQYKQCDDSTNNDSYLHSMIFCFLIFYQNYLDDNNYVLEIDCDIH